MGNHSTHIALILLAGSACVGGSPSGSSDSGGPVPDAGISQADASVDGGDAGPVLQDGGGVVEDTCGVTAPTECLEPGLRYQDIAPILSRRCESCHSLAAQVGWPLDTFTHVVDWADDIRADLVACTMPPPDAGIPITIREKTAILQWLRCGHPE